jgi:transposase
VQRLRVEYWQQVTQIAPENLVFLDQMGVQLGCSTNHARAAPGQRIYDLKPFYRGANVSVVGMDNLAAHKLKAIVPAIEAVGARVLYLSPYSPEFNPIEHWWSHLKAFIKSFSPSTRDRVDGLLATAMDWVDPRYLRNCFAHCCYCIS